MGRTFAGWLMVTGTQDCEKQKSRVVRLLNR